MTYLPAESESQGGEGEKGVREPPSGHALLVVLMYDQLGNNCFSLSIHVIDEKTKP